MPSHSAGVTIPQAVMGFCRQLMKSIKVFEDLNSYDTASGNGVLSTYDAFSVYFEDKKGVTIPQAVMGFCRQ